MKKLSEAFAAKSKGEKCVAIVSIISSLLTIICAVMQIARVWDGAIVLCQLFMGITLSMQAIMLWNRNRGVAIFSLCVAVFVFAVAAVVLGMGVLANA